MKYFAMLLFLGLALAACKQDLNTEEQDLYDSVMEIHDAVMPKIRDMRKKQRALEQIQEGLEKAEDQILVRKAIASLEKADEMMYDWMGAFKKGTDLPEGTNYSSYLENEKVSIQKVSNAMLSSINEAEELIKKFGNE